MIKVGDIMNKYIRLMDGTKSNAGGFEFKIGEINIAEKWNPTMPNPIDMGGFNFSTEEKILRWIHRGDTVYDVTLPPSAEIIDCQSENCPHGVFRTNKIILTNPRKVTEDMVLDFYKKSNLPEKTYYQCLVVLLYKNYINVAKYIIKDRINKNNINDCIKEFEKMITDKHDGKIYKFKYNELWNEAKEIYDILLKIKNHQDNIKENQINI